MIELRANVRENFIDSLARNRRITAPEAALIRSEVQNDPEGRGYAGANNGQKYALFTMHYRVSNPLPQGRVPRPGLSELQVELIDAYEASGGDPQRVERMRTMMDPLWKPFIDVPSRSDALFGTNNFPTPDEFITAIS